MWRGTAVELINKVCKSFKTLPMFFSFLYRIKVLLLQSLSRERMYVWLQSTDVLVSRDWVCFQRDQ